MRKIPEVLDGEERRKLLAVPNTRYPTGLRNLCMIRVMLNAGLRVGEVVSLQVKDVDMNTGKVTIHNGKGGKDRVLWLGEEDLALLGKWRDRKPQSTYMFTTLKGGQLSDRYIRSMVKRYAVKAGIKDIHPHTLRHTFATDLYRDTHNLVLVGKALGHSSITTTTIYTHLVDGELEGAMRSFRLEAVVA